MSRNGDWQGMHWIRDSTRYAIYWRDRNPETNKFRCLWCNVQHKMLSLDHLLPVNMGGTNHPSNLITSCLPCNVQRRSTDYESWTDSANFDLAVYQRIEACLAQPLDRKHGLLLWKRRASKSKQKCS